MNRQHALVIALSVALSSLIQPVVFAQTTAPADKPAAAPAFTEANPFYAPSKLLYQAPQFDKIKDSDFAPAIEEGMKEEIADYEKIANNPDAPTFANTIEAMERTGGLLRRVSRVFGGLVQSNTNPTLQNLQRELAPKQAAHRDAIYLNPKLFARVKAVYDQRASLDPEAKRLVEEDYKDFVRAGALLSAEDQAKLRELNKEQSKLTTEFRRRILADTNAGAIVVDDPKLLAGLSEADLAGAAQNAKERGARRQVGAAAPEHDSAAAADESRRPCHA